MPIPISCSHCNRKYQVRDELAGKVAKCPCGQNLTIPAPAQDSLMPLLDEEGIDATASDPFSRMPQEVASEGTTLPPLSGVKKRSQGEKENTFPIWAITGAGHFLAECAERLLRYENVDVFLSRAAEEVVRLAKYSPLGERGVGVGRAHGYGMSFQGYVSSANEDITVVVQAEHIEAVRNIREIAAVPGIPRTVALAVKEHL